MLDTARLTKQFQHTAARRRLAKAISPLGALPKFQHTAARRRLVTFPDCDPMEYQFQHTAARRRLGPFSRLGKTGTIVSTHSRPKAAGYGEPRGKRGVAMFQHTAARRRLDHLFNKRLSRAFVSTHSRPKAAGSYWCLYSVSG